MSGMALRNPWLWQRVEAKLAQLCEHGEVLLRVRMQDGVAVHGLIRLGDVDVSISGKNPLTLAPTPE